MVAAWRCWENSLLKRKPLAVSRRRRYNRYFPQVEVLEDRWVPATFVVNTTADTSAYDFATGQDINGNISLRSAIQAANYNNVADIIQFNIGRTGSRQTIQVSSPLPDITDSVQIDGWSQGGLGYTGPPLITIDGSNTSFYSDGAVSGLVVFTNNVEIRGLAIGNFTGDGIGVYGNDSWIYGNYIGLGVGSGGTADPTMGNYGAGIGINGSNNIIGGTDPAQANHVAYNGQTSTYTGVHVFSGTGNSIRGNEIFNNVGLGIDLGNGGVTANDPGDGDSGANDLQNFPVLSSAQYDGQNLTASFSVPSNPDNSAYPLTIDFYRADSDGQEGQVYLGSATYTSAEASSTATVSFAPRTGLVSGNQIIATATDSNGNTSEFSAPLSVTITSDPNISTPQQIFAGVGTAALGTGTVSGLNSDAPTVTINFGDGSAPVTVPVSINGTFPLTHAYGAEATYTLTATANDGGGDPVQSTSAVYILPADPISATTSTSTGSTVTATIPGAISATLTRTNSGPPPTTVLVAVLPNQVGNAASGNTAIGGPVPNPLQTIAAFDVRIYNGQPTDRITITFFVHSLPGNIPVFEYIDPTTGAKVPVQGSFLVSPSLTYQQIPGTNTYIFNVVLDRSSIPNISQLFGTVFTFSVPQGAALNTLPRGGQNIYNLANPQINVAGLSLGRNISSNIPATGFTGGVTGQFAVSSASVANLGNEVAFNIPARGPEPPETTVARALQWSLDIHRATWGVQPRQPQNNTPPNPQPPRNQQGGQTSKENSWLKALDQVFAEMTAQEKNQEPSFSPFWRGLTLNEIIDTWLRSVLQPRGENITENADSESPTSSPLEPSASLLIPAVPYVLSSTFGSRFPSLFWNESSESSRKGRKRKRSFSSP